jgi:glutamyl/glutaminyl-tRNA synthetase
VLVTRLAPTPSGYLHPGNAVNFLLTHWLARQHDGRLLLRIDDLDAARVRTAYLDDIFRVLQWLGIAIDAGPSGVAQFQREFSLLHRTEAYRAAVTQLRDAGAHVYACHCSRRDLAGHAAGYYPGTCRTAGLPERPGETALRIAVPHPMVVDVAGERIDVAGVLGDFAVWRRDDVPAYQLASVVEDHDLGVNTIVRGRDLLASTGAQLVLAPLLGATGFLAADFRHHALITDPAGRKLSKSAGRRGASMVGDTALLGTIRAAAARLAPQIGIEPMA